MIFPLGLALTLATGLVPAVSRWAATQEKRILAEGQPLPAELLPFAAGLGIAHPEEIRYLAVSPIPSPAPRFVFDAARKWGFPVVLPAGMTLGRGIYILPGHEFVLRHEIVHVQQYQRLGGIAPFMSEYLLQCLTRGYHDAPLEHEARELSR
ncbi:MAG: hypothetical protein JWO82_3368 [Akkermansiaceae bacterium]|nr:hypothetical protein [Akkermansiaceae bacterium]